MTPKLLEIARALEASRQALMGAVAGLGEADLQRRPQPDAWSAGEVLHHVARTEGSVAHLLARGLDRTPDLGPDPTPDASVLHDLDRFAIDRGTPRAQAPDFALPTPGLSRVELSESLARAREGLLATMQRADGLDLRRFAFPHPLLGPFDGFQWLVFCVQHERRHAAQAAALRQLFAGVPLV